MDCECPRCHIKYYLSEEYEPTKYCHECAHAVVEEQEQRIAELEAQIGAPPEGNHPDEALPRDVTWHKERANWQAEVAQLRGEIDRLKGELAEWTKPGRCGM